LPRVSLVSHHRNAPLALAIDTPVLEIENKFRQLLKRNDIAVILINQHVRASLILPQPSLAPKFMCHTDLLAQTAPTRPSSLALISADIVFGAGSNPVQIADEIEGLILAHDLPIPTVVIIPSKEHAYVSHVNPHISLLPSSRLSLSLPPSPSPSLSLFCLASAAFEGDTIAKCERL
jgi:vacuolar-type H+-ATPase subunit F/Vma7